VIVVELEQTDAILEMFDDQYCCSFSRRLVCNSLEGNHVGGQHRKGKRKEGVLSLTEQLRITRLYDD
jgi:hypothetical protein